MTKRYLFTTALLLAFAVRSIAGEGMWIPLLLEKYNEEDMQAMGMKITAEDIYSVNNSSLKDAVFRFGGGCTAGMISAQGLIITNHHCGYGNIQALSSLDRDLLTDGFWADDLETELPCEGLQVTRLVYMEDVSSRVLGGVEDNWTRQQRQDTIELRIQKITGEATEGTHYSAAIEPFYYGNQYFMFVTESFKDVRLVGAPPSAIGKFGGDTDNWMWPRHTGDFALFRVYAGEHNDPVEYSEDNSPYTPLMHMPISLNGAEEEDFTFVFGFPGRTQQYLTSHAVDMIINTENPERIALREMRLDIMDGYMQQSDEVRIQYAAKHARVANFYKKFQGENRGIHRLKAVEVKEEQQRQFQQWADSSPNNRRRYGDLFPAFGQAYEALTPYNMAFNYVIEAGIAVELVPFVRNFGQLFQAVPDSNLAQIKEDLQKRAESFFNDYHKPLDQDILAAVFEKYAQDIHDAFQPVVFQLVENEFDGDFSQYASYVFKESSFTSLEDVEAFLADFNATEQDREALRKDPAYQMSASVFSSYFQHVRPVRDSLNNHLDSLYRVYLEGLMKKREGDYFYPDANSTLRITYGKVEGYKPQNAVTYRHYTTLQGVFEKEALGEPDYTVPDKLRQLYKAKDFGPYAAGDGTMRPCFIASNHTSGGNSGSPVLNANGHLIGVNFDRNWEGTMSDLMYDPNQCRNISVDIRYCLFIIDKFANAGHLLEEMTIIMPR